MADTVLDKKKLPPIPYGRQEISEEDIAAAAQVLRSPYLTTGPKVAEFEEAVAARVGSRHAVAVSSGTAALHLAALAAGVQAGDEVLVPTLSFLASANCILYAGAKPIFVDSTPDGFNLDLSDALKKITPRTKAIIPVDFAGEPVDHEALAKFAKENNLVVIEDAAHALGAEDRGKPVGSLADMTVFSFHPVKHITTGEGGMVTTDNPDFAKRLKRLRHHGIDVDVQARDREQSWKYDMTELGFNYRITDIQCALGLSQLKRLDRFLARREAVAQSYGRAFASNPLFETPPAAPPHAKHAWHLYIIRLSLERLGVSRDEIFKRLREQGIGVNVHYRPIHLHSFYAKQGYNAGLCPNAENTFQRTLSLPLFSGLSEEDVRRVQSTVLETLESAKHSREKQ